MSKKQDPIVLADKGMTDLAAYQLTREICNTPGWYARQVPAFKPGQSSLEKRYWVKVCGFRKRMNTKWHYLDSREQWEAFKAQSEQPPEHAPSVSGQPSTSSATEVPNTPAVAGTSEVSVVEPLETSKYQPSS